jgi:hypothetical protein
VAAAENVALEQLSAEMLGVFNISAVLQALKIKTMVSNRLTTTNPLLFISVIILRNILSAFRTIDEQNSKRVVWGKKKNERTGRFQYLNYCIAEGKIKKVLKQKGLTINRLSDLFYNS